MHSLTLPLFRLGRPNPEVKCAAPPFGKVGHLPDGVSGPNPGWSEDKP